MAAAGIVGSGVETPWTGKGAALEPDQTTALAPGPLVRLKGSKA